VPGGGVARRVGGDRGEGGDRGRGGADGAAGTRSVPCMSFPQQRTILYANAVRYCVLLRGSLG